MDKRKKALGTGAASANGLRSCRTPKMFEEK